MIHPRIHLYFAAAVLPVCFSVAGCGPTGETAAKKEGPAAVAVAKVTRQDLAKDLELAAEFRPYQEIDLHAKVSGYLKSIHVDVGDRVRKGQLIALLEVPEMAQDMVQAAAVAKRSTLDVERVRGEVQRAESALRIRKLSYDRLAGVLKARPNLIARQEIDDSAAKLSDAEAQLSAVRAALAVTEQQVSVSRASEERTGTMMSYLRITAPFDGVITERRGDTGALVQAGTSSSTQAMPVVRLSQIERLRLVLPVPESIVPRIRIGSVVEVRVDSLNRVFHGRVSRFAGRLDTGTRTMQTEVDIPNSGYAVMPGMYGYASLQLERSQDALGVPVQAVSGHGETATVMIVNGRSQLEERKVKTGIETPNIIEILSGLQENDMVVLGSRSRLKAGVTVQPKLVERPTAGGSH